MPADGDSHDKKAKDYSLDIYSTKTMGLVIYFPYNYR
jgi:hypothetical protein